jgi:hypothetical protein
MIAFYIKNKTYTIAEILIRTLLIIGFLVGTTTHTLDIASIGFFSYKGFILFNIFWTLLVFLDPLVAFLIFIDKSVGLTFGFVIMVLDITVNSIDIFAKIANDQPFTFFYYAFQFPFFILISVYYWYSIKNVEKQG